jgi:hypothetical protein
VKWISDTEIEASCPYESTEASDNSRDLVPARLTRVAPRQWRLQQARLPTGVHMPKPPQAAPFDETVTAVELRPANDCKSFENCPERNAGLSESGYAWLGQ